ASTLAERMLRTMFLTKLKTAAAVLFGVGVLLVGAGLLSAQRPRAEEPPAVPTEPERPQAVFLLAQGEARPEQAERDAQRRVLRRGLAMRNGGNPHSEAAVAAGLHWLAEHQAEDGRWSLHEFHHPGGCTCTGFGQKNEVAATAFGLLPFLGTGITHQSG